MTVYGRIFWCVLMLLLLTAGATAQSWFVRNDSIKVFAGSGQLLNPWGGGFNSTQFSQIDFDLDGKKDIVAFDKGSFKIRCFKNTGSAGFTRYKHSPAYENLFPKVSDWVIFKDYNNDGAEDIFTYTSGGIKVYKNTSSTSLQFTLAYSLLYSDYQPGGPPYILNLYAASVGFPGLEDIDNDGDLDILTFSVFGTQVEYHQNKAVELGLPLDSLKFFMVDNCWGDFSESTCSANLNVCPLFKIWQANKIPVAKANLHAGSCILCFDNDGDGDKDMILGDISCDSIDYFNNGNTVSNAHIDNVTKTFPASQPVKMAYFPCAYYLDTDNDGARDLIVSPNNTPSSENFESAWRFKNSGTDASPIFTYLENNFLQDSMIDFGEGAYPVFADENGDGLMDILVGNFGYYSNPNYISKIALLRNTGTASLPQFTIVNRNYGNFSSLLIRDMAPSFGDLDSDGDLDLIIGDFDGKLTYYQNLAGAGNPFNLSLVTTSYKSIDVGQDSKPQIIDVDRDGLKDLLVGGRNGKVQYFRNIGTSTLANFSNVATTTSFGGVNVCVPGFITGFASPFMYDVNGAYEMLVGSERGYLYRYGNIDGNLTGTFTLIDSAGWDVWDGGKISPCVGNLDNDIYPDMVIGNYDGGLSYFAGVDPVIGINEAGAPEQAGVFPNPAQSELNISFENKISVSRTIEVLDLSGRIIFSFKTNLPVAKINCGDLLPGMYIIRYQSLNGLTGTKKFVISK
jgi:hypothetical protein